MKSINTGSRRGTILSVGLMLLLNCSGVMAHEIKMIKKYVRIFLYEGQYSAAIADGEWAGIVGQIQTSVISCRNNPDTCTEGIAYITENGNFRANFRIYTITSASPSGVRAISRLPDATRRYPFDEYRLTITDDGFVKRTKVRVDVDEETIEETATMK